MQSQFSLSLNHIFIYFQTHPSARYVLLAIILLLAGTLFLHFLNKSPKKEGEFSYKDFPHIAGDDVLATQLDLVKAYVEMGQKPLAKTLLKQAIKTSRQPQKKDLKFLLKTL